MAKASSQKFIARNRAPRVQIEYDVELYGAEKKIQLPFVMGVLADLSGKPAEPLPPVADRKFLEIDVDNFDSRMKAMKPRVAFQVPNTLTGEGNLNVELTFESMDDFSPAAVARKVDALNKLLEARQQLANLITYMDGKSGRRGSREPSCCRIRRCCRRWRRPRRRRTSPRRSSREPRAENSTWLTRNPSRTPQPKSARSKPREFDSLLRKEFKPKTDEAKEAVERAVRTLAEQALSQTTLIGADVVKSIEAIIAQLDKKLTEQINLILHHEDFQKLEGAWRGLHYLVNNTETDEMLKIRVMNISKKDLGKTLKSYKGTAWDQSPLFKKVYEAEYGQFGGEPFGCLVGDYYFDQTPARRRSCSARWRKIAAAAHAPFIAGASPTVMQMDIVAGAGQSARPDQDLHDARVRGVALAARVGGRPLPRPGDAALPGAPALRRQDQSGRGVRLRGGHRRRRSQPVHLGERRLRDGGQHQPLVQAVRLVLAHPRHRVGRRGRRAADAHVPDRRRRRRHEVPDRDRDQRPPRGGAGEERLHAARAPQELRLRGVHRRAVAAEAGRVRRSGRDRQREPGGAAAVPVRLLPLRALPEVHRPRQDRLVQGARRHAALAAELDHELRRRRSGAFVARRPRRRSRWRRPKSRSRKSRATPGTTRRSSSCGRTISSKA